MKRKRKAKLRWRMVPAGTRIKGEWWWCEDRDRDRDGIRVCYWNHGEAQLAFFSWAMIRGSVNRKLVTPRQERAGQTGRRRAQARRALGLKAKGVRSQVRG